MSPKEAGFITQVALRPVLVVDANMTRAGQLISALQLHRQPCVVALDPAMFQVWREALRPVVVVLNLDLSWARETAGRLINEGITVVALSEVSRERMSAINLGCQEVLQLSLSCEEIAAVVVSRCCSHRTEEPSACPHAEGPLKVDFAKRAVFWDGLEVETSPILFSLASYFASRPGVFISINTLLQEVWAEAWATPEKVHQGVSRLRRVLGPGSSAFIRSKRGFYGYLPD